MLVSHVIFLVDEEPNRFAVTKPVCISHTESNSKSYQESFYIPVRVFLIMLTIHYL